MYEFLFKFYKVLYRFLETGTSDRCLLWYRLKAEILSFHPIPPFIFPLSPFKKWKKLHIVSIFRASNYVFSNFFFNCKYSTQKICLKRFCSNHSDYLFSFIIFLFKFWYPMITLNLKMILAFMKSIFNEYIYWCWL